MRRERMGMRYSRILRGDLSKRCFKLDSRIIVKGRGVEGSRRAEQQEEKKEERSDRL